MSRIIIPENTIAAIPYDDYVSNNADNIFHSLSGEVKRDWFSKHAYHCLPLVIGNQYGFVVKSLYDFIVNWDGGEGKDSVTVMMLTQNIDPGMERLQSIKSHFGMGTFTVQTGYSLRTPPGINLLVSSPPNKFIDGIAYMSAVIETDNLRRDFTFNLKITRPNHSIRINRGDWIGYFIPYPRHFVDKFTIVESDSILTQEQIKQEQQCGEEFAKERTGPDQLKKNKNGRLYRKGVDVYGNKFVDHQTHLDNK
jgi:hypothetical protein